MLIKELECEYGMRVQGLGEMAGVIAIFPPHSLPFCLGCCTLTSPLLYRFQSNFVQWQHSGVDACAPPLHGPQSAPQPRCDWLGRSPRFSLGSPSPSHVHVTSSWPIRSELARGARSLVVLSITPLPLKKAAQELVVNFFKIQHSCYKTPLVPYSVLREWPVTAQLSWHCLMSNYIWLEALAGSQSLKMYINSFIKHTFISTQQEHRYRKLSVMVINSTAITAKAGGD